MDIDDRGFSQRSHRLFHDASHLQEKNIDFRVTQIFFSFLGVGNTVRRFLKENLNRTCVD